MKTTYLELFQESSVNDFVITAIGFETIERARDEFRSDISSTNYTPLAILQIDVDDNNKVTVTEVPAEEPREYFFDELNLPVKYPMTYASRNVDPATIYVRNEAGGLDVVTGEERQSVVDRFFK